MIPMMVIIKEADICLANISIKSLYNQSKENNLMEDGKGRKREPFAKRQKEEGKKAAAATLVVTVKSRRERCIIEYIHFS